MRLDTLTLAVPATSPVENDSSSLRWLLVFGKCRLANSLEIKIS